LQVTPAHPNRHYHKMPGKSFLKGPVPLLWLTASLKAGGSAAAVGLYLWYLRGLRKTSEDLIVTRRGALAALGVKERTLRRGLGKLETAGLVSTTRGRGKAIRVTLLRLEGPPTPATQPLPTSPFPPKIVLAPAPPSGIRITEGSLPSILLKSLREEVSMVRRTSQLPEEVKGQ
jgi:hypothetical protein